MSETSEAAVNVPADEGDCLLLDVSRILNCNIQPDLTEIAQYSTQLAAFQKVFDHFKEMTIFNGVISEGVKESFQATIQYVSTYFSSNIANLIDFWSKVLTLKKDDQLMKLFLLIVEIYLCGPFSNATLERLFSQMNFVKTIMRNMISNESLNPSVRIQISGILRCKIFTKHMLKSVFSTGAILKTVEWTSRKERITKKVKLRKQGDLVLRLQICLPARQTVNILIPLTMT